MALGWQWGPMWLCVGRRGRMIGRDARRGLHQIRRRFVTLMEQNAAGEGGRDVEHEISDPRLRHHRLLLLLLRQVDDRGDLIRSEGECSGRRRTSSPVMETAVHQVLLAASQRIRTDAQQLR